LMAETQLDSTAWLILLFLAVLLVILGYLYHNDWDTKAAGKEAEQHAKLAAAEMKKGAHAAAVQVEKATRQKEGDQAVADKDEPTFGFPKFVEATADAPVVVVEATAEDAAKDTGTERPPRKTCC